MTTSGRLELQSGHEAVEHDIQDLLKQAKRLCPLLARSDQLTEREISGLDNKSLSLLLTLEQIQCDVISSQEAIFKSRWVIPIPSKPQESTVIISLISSRDQITRKIDSLISLTRSIEKQSRNSAAFLDLNNLRNGYCYFKTELFLAVSLFKSKDADRGSKLVAVLERNYEMHQAIQDFLFNSLH